MESKWLEEQERVINEFREKKRKQLPMVVGIICLVMLSFMALALINGGIPEEGMPVVLITMGLVIGVTILALLLGIRQNKKQGCPRLRKNLEKILSTPEETTQFDSEMVSTPLHRVQLKDGQGEYYFTEHYLVYTYGKCQFKDYNIFKLSDIYSTKTVSWKDNTSVTGLGREYMTNLCDKDRNVLGGIAIKKKKPMEEFIEALQRFVPNVKLGEGK